MESFPYINEEFFASHVTPEQTDFLLSQGWRHFGEHFYRYSLGFYKYEIRKVYSLRINLRKFSLSKSHRRVLRKNQDLHIIFRPAEITDEKHELFERHKRRFKYGIPSSLYDFLSHEPAKVPCTTLECAVYKAEKILAASFFDVGSYSVSSVYAMFEPEEKRRSLGILTMLLEIDFALKNGKKFYYHGYIYEGKSFYDYKKRFSALEVFDWRGNWTDFRYSE
jgi:arginine-tRNA-protein transferase